MKNRMGLSGWTHSGMVLLALLTLLAECGGVGAVGTTVIDSGCEEEGIDTASGSGVVGLGGNDGSADDLSGAAGAAGTNSQRAGPGTVLWNMQQPWRMANMNTLTDAQQQHLEEAINEDNVVTGQLDRYHSVWVRWVEADSSVAYFPAYIDSCQYSHKWEYMVMWLSHRPASRVNSEELMHRTSSVRYDNWSVNEYMLETARVHAASTSASSARISRHVCHAQGAFLTEGSDLVGPVAGGSGSACAGPRSDAARPVQSKKRARESNCDSKSDSKVAVHESLAVAAGGAQHGNTRSAPAGVNTRVSTIVSEQELTKLLYSLTAQNAVILARIQACEEGTAAAIAAATRVTAVATAIVATAAAAVAASSEATAAATTATAELHSALGSMTAIMNGFGMVRGAVAQSNATQVRVVMHEHLASTHSQDQDQIALSTGPSERNFPVPPRESSDGRRDLGGASKQS